jgi:hypothetical protein
MTDGNSGTEAMIQDVERVLTRTERRLIKEESEKRTNFDPQRAVNLIGPAMEQTAQAAVVNIRQSADQCLAMAQSLKADADALADDITHRVRAQSERLNEFALTVQALIDAMQQGRERIEILGSPKRER